MRGFVLLIHGGPQRDDGIALLAAAREAALQERFTLLAVFAFIDTHLANEKIRVGDLDGAIELSLAAIEADYASGEMVVRAATVAALVEALLLQMWARTTCTKRRRPSTGWRRCRANPDSS